MNDEGSPVPENCVVVLILFNKVYEYKQSTIIVSSVMSWFIYFNLTYDNLLGSVLERQFRIYHWLNQMLKQYIKCMCIIYCSGDLLIITRFLPD